MIPENPSEEQAQQVIGNLDRQALQAKSIYDRLPGAEAGFVTWAALPPAGTSWADHRGTFLEAVYMALSFCDTRFKNEWLVVGQFGAVVLRTLHNSFIEVEGVDCFPVPMIFIGHVRFITVYMKLDGPQKEFYAGNESKAARGLIADSPHPRA